MAISWEMKQASLAQEMIRRLINNSQELRSELVTFICKLEYSGCDGSRVRDIVTSGLRVFKTRLKKAKE